MSGVYTYRWQTASQMQEGQIFGPYEDNGMLCIMKCTDRTGDGSLDFAAVKGQIERYLQAGQAQEIIADRMEDAQISPGSISPEEIIVSL